MEAAIIVIVAVVTILSAVTGGGGPTKPQATPPSFESAVSIDQNLPASDYNAVLARPLFEDSLRNYILRKGPLVNPEDADQMSKDILANAQQFDVNPRLVAALIQRESRFNKNAVSSSGAIGLGQLLPSTAASIGVMDPYNISDNVRGTVRYIRLMLDRFVGNDQQVPLALASYKQGYGSIRDSGGQYTDETKRYIIDILTSMQAMD